jgi:hypothetical protein
MIGEKIRPYNIYCIGKKGQCYWISHNNLGTDAKSAITKKLSSLKHFNDTYKPVVWLVLPNEANPSGKGCLFEIDFSTNTVVETLP